MKKVFPATIILILLASVCAGAQETILVNPYKDIILEKSISFSLGSILKGVLGMAVIVFVCWCFSSNRKRIDWGTVGKALLLQFAIAVSVLAFPAVQSVFEVLGRGFVAVLGWTKAGSNFLLFARSVLLLE